MELTKDEEAALKGKQGETLELAYRILVGDLITLGSPQLCLEEISNLSIMLQNKSFKKRCMVFCPRAVQQQSRNFGF